MSDVLSKAKRSEVMTRIRSRGNKTTELAFAKLLRRHRISGWRRHVPLTLLESMDGCQKVAKRRPHVKPDFVFQELRIAVFIDGCFWHGCPIHGTKPAANREFWRIKLNDNRARDRFVTNALRKQNWTVMRLWEHQLSKGEWVVAKFQLCLAQATRTVS